MSATNRGELIWHALGEKQIFFGDRFRWSDDLPQAACGNTVVPVVSVADRFGTLERIV